MIFVIDGIRHFQYQVKAQATGHSIGQRRTYIHLSRDGWIETIHIVIGETDLDPVLDWLHLDKYFTLGLRIVRHHVDEQFFQ